MKTKTDITELNDEEFEDEVDDEEQDDEEEEDQDDEAESDDENEDDDEEEPKSKSRKPSTKNLARRSDIAELQSSIAQLQKLAAGGTKAEQKKVSRVAQLFGKLEEQGYKKQQLAPLAALIDGLRADLEDEYKEKADGQKVLDFNERCWDAMSDEIDKLSEQYPSVAWAKDSMMKKAAKLMESSPKFVDAQKAYASGRVPTRGDFSKAVRMVFEIFAKESGMKKGANSDQLDVKTSKAKPSSAISKTGEVSLNKLSDFEREVYVTTLNVTKNKELALDALKAAMQAPK